MAETGASVPLAPLALSRAGVQSGRPVRGGAAQWASYAAQANHLHGRGGVTIPWSCIDSDLSIGATQTYRFRVLPRYAATHRTWRFTLATSGAGGLVFGVFTDPSGGTASYSMSGTWVRTYDHVETISSRTASESELAPTFSLDAASTKTARLLAITCVEHPRADLAIDTNDYGTKVSTCQPGGEIADYAAGYSLGSVAVATKSAASLSQRNGLFALSRDTTNALNTTSAAYTRVLPLGADPVIIGRQLYRSATTRTVKVAAYAYGGDGSTTGNLRFTMGSGDSLVLAIASATPSWLTGEVDIDSEDFSVGATGNRQTPGDKCVIEWQRTAGTKAVYLESIGINGG